MSLSNLQDYLSTAMLHFQVDQDERDCTAAAAGRSLPIAVKQRCSFMLVHNSTLLWSTKLHVPTIPPLYTTRQIFRYVHRTVSGARTRVLSRSNKEILPLRPMNSYQPERGLLMANRNHRLRQQQK